MKTYEEKYKERENIQKKIIDKQLNLKKPFMEDDEIAVCEKILLEKGKSINVLEWGAGYSTKYFTDVLHKNKIKFIWDSLEYDKRWATSIAMLELHKGVTIYLFDEEIMRIDDRRALRSNMYPMTEYINFPKSLGRKYDVIFIDGEKRVECMKIAVGLSKPEGTIILHDAKRPEYKEGIDLYNGKKVSYNLWIGKLKSQ